MRNVVIIFGYNNTRTYDIERLKKICKLTLDSEILLCKESISDHDRIITSYNLQINLEISDVDIIKHQLKEIDSYINTNMLNPIACLPFSDKGIPLGSYYAQSRGLPHDDCKRSFACIDKYVFRCLEADEITPLWYKKPFFEKIYAFDDAKNIVSRTKVPLFFKPTTEGNSRGCIEINSIDDLIKNKDILELYFNQGVIVEECINNCEEYSFDGVDGCYVITEKKTSNGYYRVETQHILPAPLSQERYNRLLEAGMIVAKISGSVNGANHNELFLNKETNDVYCVEPNRRPAGLKVWDWIKIAYPGVDNWDSWVNWASGTKKARVYPIKNEFYVGCKMLQSTKCGFLVKIDDYKKNTILKRDEVVDICISKIVGNNVTSVLKDNSDFMGYVVCKSRSIDNLRLLLDSVEKEALSLLEIV